MNNSNRANIILKAKDILEPEYLAKFFDADSFFNTTYETGILKGKYFITCDAFMSTPKWALKMFNADTKSIDTIEGSPFANKDECLAKLKEIA